MRIYELAKSIGQTFNIKVKPSDLADEFKNLPDFAEIHDTIKSHSSSVDDKYARRMYQIYGDRQGKEVPADLNMTADTETAAPARPANAKATPHPPRTPSKPAAAQQAPAQTPPKPPRPATPLPPNRPAAPSAGGGRPGAPLRPAIPRPSIPIPVRPAPLRPMPIPPVARASETATAEAPKPQIPADKRPPAPTAPGAPVTMRPVAPKPAQKPRPTGLASNLRSSTGTTGITAEPTSHMDRKGAGAIGQPTAPAMPKFSSDSTFGRILRGEKATPPPPPPRRAPSDRQGPAQGGETTAPPRSREPRRDGAPADPNAPMPLPEIGVMRLKSGTKRHRPAAEKAGTGGRGRTAKEKEQDEAAKAKAAAAKKGVRPSKVYSDPEQFRRAPIKPVKRTKTSIAREKEEARQAITGPVIITGPLTVAEFADKLGQTPGELIKRAFMKGKGITINQLIDLEFAEELAFELDIDLQIQLEGDETDFTKFRGEEKDNPEDYIPRPPVVTIMGHVDHGKTSVLDFFRKSRVVEGEFGGITQHIGAYKVETAQGDIVFLDTPGHEAFTSMRARGVKSTDIAVLVVAADDGVMPQTVESINHARAANVPMIVAINKIDLPTANPDRVRQELLQHQVVGTALGGETEFVEISAKKGTNMESLLEVISLQSQVLELKANPKRRAEGIVIESHVDPQRGAVATILVQQGTLKVGDLFVVGAQSGRVRQMLDDIGRPVKEGKLSIPVELIGLSGTPDVGETLMQMDNEREARDIAERRAFRRRLMELGTTRHITLEGLHDQIQAGKVKELNVILRADVQGSIEAIDQAFDKLAADAIRIRVLHSGTGPISESDVSLAMASNAVIIGFNVRPEASAADMAQAEGVEIRTYRIIYELLEEIERSMLGLMDKRYQEQVVGRSEVREVFKVSKHGNIAGCMVLMGEMQRGSKARLVRDGSIVYDGSIGSLRRVKDDVSKVAAGYECGIGLERFGDIKPGDVIETYVMEEVAVELVRSEKA